MVGFIAADGCLTKHSKESNNLKLTITIHKKDRIILDNLKNELESNNKICTINRTSSFGTIDAIRFSITNKQISNDLLRLGIKPRKSLGMNNIISNIPKKYRKSFILGYFDGDGCIYTQDFKSKNGYHHKRGYVSIRGTFEFLQGIVDELSIKSYYLKQHDSIPSLSIGSKEGIKIFYSIYKNSTLFLERKHSKFIEYFNLINKVRTISSP